ncbi:NUDIX hydrolase [Helicobacter jaachi]|uniref:NUDIX hydrolase n=1 Tax=Helicobacter jaachi TaxID=1677920 RepID=A0A4U8TBP3_9HELI|nr:NUDIX hydrolase [Helicobacter jaachi]TLD97356.1 NUDIX hydrolase [Helicobacter jaachi]
MKHLLSPLSHISNVSFCECVDSKYVKALRMLYSENGISRSWDFIHSLDSVAIVLYHRQKDSLLFVKQFRPAVFVRTLENYNAIQELTQDMLQSGYTFELCAGLVDKAGKSLEQIAKEEVQEECGYCVRALEKIGAFVTAVGHSGAKQTLFYASISEVDRVSEGGGIDGEVIENIFVPVSELESFIENAHITKTPGLGFGVLWFLRHYERLKKI